MLRPLGPQVQDAGTKQGLNSGKIFSRSLRVPTIWVFQPASTCPRATYASPAASQTASRECSIRPVRQHNECVTGEMSKQW